MLLNSKIIKWYPIYFSLEAHPVRGHVPGNSHVSIPVIENSIYNFTANILTHSSFRHFTCSSKLALIALESCTFVLTVVNPRYVGRWRSHRSAGYRRVLAIEHSHILGRLLHDWG